MEQNFKSLYSSDMNRYGKVSPGRGLKRFHYYFRKAQTSSNKLLQSYYRFRFSRIKAKYHIELYAGAKVGKGLYLGHPYGITINPKAEIGENVNIHKGVTIGQENRGIRKGVPTIGNRVWIGINATIVGKITIGDNVLIAPNTYVNCDVPSNSVVFGNPCIVKEKANATEGYVNNLA